MNLQHEITKSKLGLKANFKDLKITKINQTHIWYDKFKKVKNAPPLNLNKQLVHLTTQI